MANSINDLHHLFVVRAERRDRLGAFLLKHGVETRIHFPKPLHLQHGPWKNPSQPLPVAEKWCRSILTLPCFPGLKRAEIKYIAELIARFFETSRAVSLRSARPGTRHRYRLNNQPGGP